ALTFLGPVVIFRQCGTKAYRTAPQSLLNQVLQSDERSSADEENVGCVDLNKFLMGVLASSLRGNVGYSSFKNLEQCLLHPFTGYITGDRRVLILARDLVDLVDIDDPLHTALAIASGSLQELQNNVLDIFPDITRFCQGCSVDNRKRNR